MSTPAPDTGDLPPFWLSPWPFLEPDWPPDDDEPA